MRPLSIFGVAILALSTAFGQLPFERDEYTSPMKTGTRPRVTKHTMIFARIQPYSLSGNYLDTWIDRPLYLNSEWRGAPSQAYRNAPEVKCDAESAQEYEIDGFTMLGSAYVSCYRATLRFLSEAKFTDFQFMPGLAWGETVPYDHYKKNAEEAFKSPFTTKINGKVPFFSYVSMPVEKIRKVRAKLSADGYSDIFLFDNLWLNIFGKYSKNQALSDADMAECEAQVQAKLADLDGIIFVAHHMDRDPKGDYTLLCRYYPELTEKYLAPLLEKVYRDPVNSGKLLGMNIGHGYLGHMSGCNEAELGTSQLRAVLDAALLLNPDILSLAEWNEANENTSFQPNLYNSKSLQRLIRFYARHFKGLPPTPNPGDDLAIPNLVISTRQTIKLGERYRIELLNIPDSTEENPYTVQLTLVNEDFEEIHRFAPDQFQADQLTAITYHVPSESMAAHLAVIPVLDIHYKGQNWKFESLQYTRLAATIGWNFKEVRQPLRDILIPKDARLEFSNGRITAAIDAGTTLASMELLDNEEEIHAFDRLNKFDHEKYHTILVNCQNKNTISQKLELIVPGVPDFQFHPWGRPYAGFGELTKNGDTLHGKFLIWHGGGSILLNIPKDRFDAEIKFTIDGFSEVSVRLAEILKRKKYGVELPGALQVYFFHREKLADHPVHIDANQAAFTVDISSEYNIPCYQLRAITKDGKIFRSKPIFPKALGGKQEAFNIFSATQRKAVTLHLPSERIEESVYLFEPDSGLFLKNNASPKWDGILGGGFRYLHPMRYVNLPAGVAATAPAWIRNDENTGWLLRFDGSGNYLIFPMEAFPTGPFTLEFECRTSSQENQRLFRHGSLRQSSLDLYIVNGKLQASFAHMGYNYANQVEDIPVNLEFPLNQWNRIKVQYDYQKLRFAINDQSAEFSFRLRAFKPTAATFGGEYGKDENTPKYNLQYFNGDLRSLKIRRNAGQTEEIAQRPRN